METTLLVPGMTCAHCTRAVEAEVRAVAGVTAVSADLETKVVSVTGERVDEEAVRAAVADAGYRAE